MCYYQSMDYEPSLDNLLCFALYSASMAINRTYKPLLDSLGITYPQYLVLNALWEQDERSIGAIADRLGLDPSTVTPLVKRLEAGGFVARTRHKSDERRVLVTLTAQGKSLETSSRCLGVALLEKSGMEPMELVNLDRDVRRLRDALVAGDEAPSKQGT